MQFQIRACMVEVWLKVNKACMHAYSGRVLRTKKKFSEGISVSFLHIVRDPGLFACIFILENWTPNSFGHQLSTEQWLLANLATGQTGHWKNWPLLRDWSLENWLLDKVNGHCTGHGQNGQWKNWSLDQKIIWQLSRAHLLYEKSKRPAISVPKQILCASNIESIQT